MMREAEKASRAPRVRSVVPSTSGAECIERDGWIVCRACAAFIAETRSRIEVNGAHAHSFINPAGAIFRVGCHAHAPGVVGVGEESDEWTWFTGFSWQVAVCGRCGEHLGWCYRNALARFVALILDRVAEHGPRPD
jgi:hypothetical protein